MQGHKITMFNSNKSILCNMAGQKLNVQVKAELNSISKSGRISVIHNFMGINSYRYQYNHDTIKIY